jgi:hypothetical protein
MPDEMTLIEGVIEEVRVEPDQNQTPDILVRRIPLHQLADLSPRTMIYFWESLPAYMKSSGYTKLTHWTDDLTRELPENW